MHTLFFDGCSKGNPGKGGAGAVLYNVLGQEMGHSVSYVGDSVTNNVAEYNGLIQGLELATHHDVNELIVKGDSLLVIKQMKGEYKVNAPSLIELYKKAQLLASTFGKISFQHVYRNENKRADTLSNEALK